MLEDWYFRETRVERGRGETQCRFSGDAVMMFRRRGTMQNVESVLCLQTSLGNIQSLQYLLIEVVTILDSGTSGNSNTGSSLATCLPCTHYQ